MTLKPQHREALLNELEKSQVHLESIKTKKLNDENEWNDWYEAIAFLEDERIKLIKKSLIANEIDY